MSHTDRHDTAIDMKHLVSLLCAVLLLGTAASEAKQPKQTKKEPLLLIVETDMGNDIDDALAFDLIYKAVDDGLAKLLAVGNHKSSPTANEYVDILNTWYGYGKTPLAYSTTPVRNDHNPDYTIAVAGMKRADGKPAFAHSKRPSQIENPVALYRRTLAKAADHSVTFISLGFATELAKLLDSPADEHSPLSGRDLVAKKVKVLSIMAGSYGKKKRAEYNVVNDIPAMTKVFAEWPTPIVQNPFELGKRILYPATVIDGQFGWTDLHPVVEGYRHYLKMPYNRPTWDLLSVVWLLHPEMFVASETGKITVDAKGYTHFTPSAEGNHRWLTATDEQCKSIRDYIVATTTRQPKHLKKSNKR